MLVKSLVSSLSVLLPCVLVSFGNVQKVASTTNFQATSTHEEKVKHDSKLISIATPTTYYVSGSGSDTNSGLSTSSPFKTIQRAANLTNPGDRVMIMNGVYTNSHPLGEVILITRSGNANAWISYQAYPGHKPKLKHNGWNGISMRNGVSYIEINGLEIEGNNSNITLNYALSQKTNTSNQLTNGNCIKIDGRNNGHPHHIRILNNKIHSCGGAGISALQTDYLTIRGNEVFNNSWYSLYANSGITIYQSWNYDNTKGYRMSITNNEIYNNRQYVPWIANGAIQDGHGLIIDDSVHYQNGSTLPPYEGRTLIANNITYNNGGSGIITHRSAHVDILNNVSYLNNQSPEITHGQIIANISSDVKILNNILYAFPNKRVNNNWQNTNVTYDYNVYANSSTISVKGPNDILADPKFINPSSADFRLQATSPAIDRGLVWNMIKTDYLNNPRPSGVRYDIGAYEYQF